MTSSISRGEKIFGGVLLFGLLVKAMYFAVQGFPGIGPDELYHLQVIDVHARLGGIFPFYGDSNLFSKPLPAFSKFGDTVEYPLLYHFLAGRFIDFLGLDIFRFSTIVLVRLLNTVVTLVNSLLLFRYASLLLDDAPARLLFYALTTSLLSYGLLAGTVGYDPLSTLCCTAMLGAFLMFCRSVEWPHLLSMSTFAGLGILVKWSVLPLAFFCMTAAAAVLVMSRRSNLRAYLSKNLGAYPVRSIATSVFMCFVAVFIASKFIKYGRLIPECTQIFTADECSQYLSLTPAPVARDMLPMWRYFFVWMYYMVRSIFGIRSYIDVVPTTGYLIACETAVLISLSAALVSSVRRSIAERALIFVTIGYGVILFRYCGYLPYRLLHHPELGVNGRYAFPLLLPLGAYTARALLRPLRAKRRAIGAILLSVIVIYEEFPAFIMSGAGRRFLAAPTPGWYRVQPYGPNPVYNENLRLVEVPAGSIDPNEGRGLTK